MEAGCVCQFRHGGIFNYHNFASVVNDALSTSVALTWLRRRDGEMVNRAGTKHQTERFKEAARESGADMSKDELGRVIGGLAKPERPATDEKSEKDQTGGE